MLFLVAFLANDSLADDYPSSRGLLQGDHLRTTSDLYGLIPTSAGVTGVRCAGRDSTYVVDRVGKDETFITFLRVGEPKSKDTCPENAVMAQEASQYKLPNEAFQNIGFKTTGVAYGALVVPFKFRLGDDKKLVSSTTIAPYLGIRWYRLNAFGVDCIPVFAAGLGLVPVTDQTTKKTETKAAFSSAIGITLTSSKSADFSAGILFGKDFLGTSDRAQDPSVNKPWVSIWLGVSK